MFEDKQFYQREYTHICGVDEAGRGPWAGPVYAAAVILPYNYDLPGLNDSKKLSEKARECLYESIIEQATSYSVSSVSSQIIDKYNILEATKKAMMKAIKKLKPQADFLLIDGLNLNIREVPQLQLIHGDSRSANIAAASILAKVSRDRHMLTMHQKYPQYGFDQHKGYGTSQHSQALRAYGPCPIHRKCFEPVRKVLL